MSLAEIAYTRGLVSTVTTKADLAAARERGDSQRALQIYFGMIERSLNDLARAGEWYPYDFRFRTAQAGELYKLVAFFPDLAGASEQTIGYALLVDQNEAPLVAGRLIMQRRLGDCDGARLSEERLMRLAHRSEKALRLLASPNPCREVSNVPPR